MTAQEAKQQLERIWKSYTSAYDTISREDVLTFEMATNAIGAIDQIQWERDLAIKQLHDLGYGLGEKPREEANNSNQEVKKSNNLIERQAAIDANSSPELADIKIGKSKSGITMWYECGYCGEPVDIGDKFCRNCGRRLIYE